MNRSGYSMGAAAAAVVITVYNLAVVLAVVFFVPKMVRYWDLNAANVCAGVLTGISVLGLGVVLLLKRHMSERLRTMVFVSCGLTGIVVFRWFITALMR